MHDAFLFLPLFHFFNFTVSKHSSSSWLSLDQLLFDFGFARLVFVWLINCFCFFASMFVLVFGIFFLNQTLVLRWWSYGYPFVCWRWIQLCTIVWVNELQMVFEFSISMFVACVLVSVAFLSNYLVVTIFWRSVFCRLSSFVFAIVIEDLRALCLVLLTVLMSWATSQFWLKRVFCCF